ncbi:MAG: beta-ketoacyl synthase [Halodesulfovibrio sp.]|uniref:beta-ketoacyl-[acyl-carrier-protein] synthase family protein n=1 Tax=Halodesulfovibrio sp. TaxID=1912772 RepID=UPI00359DDC1B
MQLNRVVITGMGAISPFGEGVDSLHAGIAEMRSAITHMERAHEVQEMRSHIAGLVPELNSKTIPRKDRRTMTEMGVFAFLSAKEALAMAGVTETDVTSGRLGMALSCTTNCGGLIEDFFTHYLPEKTLDHCKSTTFFKFMGHAAVSSVAQALGVTGRILAPAAACATSSQSIGLGYETILLGQQDMMICGGTEELHPLSIASFDFINAASTSYNDTPQETPRPFDTNRDGVVCAEGAGLLLLESYDHAVKRGAHILAEIVGFSTLSSPKNPANPDSDAIKLCMQEALRQAGLAAEDIDYLNAHATGTSAGDIAEAKAIEELFGTTIPVSSFKGHMGHTLAASGALETIATISGLQDETLYPTRNLEQLDPECGSINLFTEAYKTPVTYFLKNSFALGGINASLILRRL